MDKYSVKIISIRFQVLMEVLYIIILCSIKEMNLDTKKINSKSIIASKQKINSHTVTWSRTYGMNQPEFSGQ